MNYSPQSFHEKLDASLIEMAGSSRYLIGLSGGLDSVVLLHGVAQLRMQAENDISLRAIHVNHQLSVHADSWENFCSDLCQNLGVQFTSVRVSIPETSGLENAAREARYAAFEEALQEDEALLLAHHRDDQMETLLQRLMRGAGSRGLSGIPRSRSLGRGRLLRPLLGIDRAELRNYGDAARLAWIEDDSNSDESFDRNFLRHSIIPLIEKRWPSFRASWSKTAVLAEEGEALLAELAAIDLAESATDSPSILDREKLLALPERRRRNLLRFWLDRFDVKEPGWNQLQQLSGEVLEGSGGQFVAEEFQIHCYRNEVHILCSKELAREPNASVTLGRDVIGGGETPLDGNGCLLFAVETGKGIATQKINDLSIRYRVGGESCRLVGRPSKSLKKLLQETEMPPWLRDRIPLLYQGEDLICIPGIGVSEAYAAEAGQAGCSVEWQQPNLALRYME